MIGCNQATEGSHIPYYLSWGSERITMETRILNFKEQTGEWMLRNSVGGKERERERKREGEESNQRPFSSISIKALGPYDVYILLLRMQAPLSPFFLLDSKKVERRIHRFYIKFYLVTSIKRKNGRGLYDYPKYLQWRKYICNVDLLTFHYIRMNI